MPSIDGTVAQPLTRRLQRAKSRKGRFLLATFQEVVDSIRPDAACLQVLLFGTPLDGCCHGASDVTLHCLFDKG